MATVRNLRKPVASTTMLARPQESAGPWDFVGDGNCGSAGVFAGGMRAEEFARTAGAIRLQLVSGAERGGSDANRDGGGGFGFDGHAGDCCGGPSGKSAGAFFIGGAHRRARFRWEIFRRWKMRMTWRCNSRDGRVLQQQIQAPLTRARWRFISGIHLPPGVQNQPPADLYGIENTNRGCTLSAELQTHGYLPSAPL